MSFSNGRTMTYEKHAQNLQPTLSRKKCRVTTYHVGFLYSYGFDSTAAHFSGISKRHLSDRQRDWRHKHMAFIRAGVMEALRGQG